MSMLRRAIGSLEDSIERLGQSARWAVWPVLYAMSVATSLWLWRHSARAKLYVGNRIAFTERSEIGIWVAVALGALLSVYALAVGVDRLRSGHWRGSTIVTRLNRALTGLLALPLVAALFEKNIESKDPIWTCVLSVGAALAIAVSCYGFSGPNRAASLDADPDEAGARWEGLRGWVQPKYRVLLPWLVGAALLALWAIYGYLLSRFAITNHHALNTRTTDLGYYDNIFYQSLHGRPLGCSFIKGGTHMSAHFDPILVLLSPLYRLYGRAELLLVLQSVWLGSGVFPVYLIAVAKLRSRWAGLVLAACFVLYPAMHGANMYEFHSLALITPLMLWLLYFLEQRRFKSYALTLLLLWLCREDVPLICCFVGAYCIISKKRGFVRVGLLTIVGSLAYYAVAKGVFMPSAGLLNSGTKKAYSYEYYFRDLIPHRRGVAGLGLTLITNPSYVLDTVLLNVQKQLYLLQLFLPLGLLPLLAKRGRLMLVYGLLVTMLASRKPVYKIYFQYSCLIFPIAFALAPQGLNRLLTSSRLAAATAWRPEGLRRAALGGLLVTSLLLSWKFGVFWPNTAFRGGFARIARPPLSKGTALRYQKVRALADKIPAGASVTTTNRLGPQVSNRKDVYFYRSRKQTDYVFADTREIRKKAKKWHGQRLQSGELVELGRYRSFVLWRVEKSRIKETKKLQAAAKKKAKADRAAKKRAAAEKKARAKSEKSRQLAPPAPAVSGAASGSAQRASMDKPPAVQRAIERKKKKDQRARPR